MKTTDPGRRILPFNTDWLYCAKNRAAFSRVTCDEAGFDAVCLPHSNVELPLNYFSDRDFQFVSWYRKHFTLPASMKGRRVFVDFGGVMLSADVFVNGRKVASHQGGYVPFSVELTDHINLGRGADNVLAVRVDSRLDPGVPPCGHVMDYLTFGGIYRDVQLRVVNDRHLASVFAQPQHVLRKQQGLTVEVELSDAATGNPECELVLELLDAEAHRVAVGEPVPVGPDAATTRTLSLPALDGIQRWTLDNPALYTARVSLAADGRVIDRMETRFGFREAVFTKAGPFKLNGRKLDLVGLNRHQTYPFIGAAAPARLQRRDADVLKFELGCNIVRTSHYPQSPHFLDRCDEIGLLVFEEIPGWGHIGDAGWKELACRDVREMIRRDRNHPSIILWGVRINESGDDHDFYDRTNQIARALDPTRPTGGVRWGLGSELLEDVYTTNDFSYTGEGKVISEPNITPYLITEYIGFNVTARHTDTGTQLVKHAMAFAEVRNAILGHPKIAGGIGWCAFDHHSQDWVTVDGVQPVGVCDIFRFHKFAGHFCESQIDPKVRPVLHAATRWRVGDQAHFDPNIRIMVEGHDAGLVVFTNCSRVEVYVGEEKRGSYRPDREHFPHLAHPPVFCTDIGRSWGPSWQELRVVGYHNNRPVAEQRFPADNHAADLSLRADDAELVADGSDMTRLLFCHVDRYGNVQPYSHAAVTLSVRGPASLVGDNPFGLVGGVGAVYLRAGRRPGAVTVTARAPGLPSQTIKVVIRRAAP